MRALIILGFGILLLSAPSLSYAETNAVDRVATTIKENPGKTLGIAGCIAVIIFPPAAVWCAATLIGGATVDGDVQNVVEEVLK